MLDENRSRQDLLTEIARLRARLSQPAAEANFDLRDLFENTPNIILILDEQGRVVMANQHAAQHFGHAQAALPGMTLSQLLPETHQQYQRRITQVLQSGEPFAWQEKRPTGQSGWRLTTLDPLHLPDQPLRYIRMTTCDISERLKPNQTLINERDLFQHLFQNSPIGIILLDADGVFQRVNQHVERIFGMPAEKIRGQPITIMHGNLHDEHGTPLPLQDFPFARIKRTLEPFTNQVYIIGPPGGSHKHILVNASPLFDAQGTFTGMLASIADITELAHIRRDLQTVHDRLTFHMTNSPLAVIEWNEDLRVITYSGQAEAIFGWPAEEVLGLRWDEWDYVHPEDIPHVDDLNVGLLSTEQPDQFITINRNLRKDGTVIWCQWFVSLQRDAEGGVASILTFVDDITERIAQERALQLNKTMLAQAQEIAQMSSFSWDISTNTVIWSTDMRQQFDLPEEISPYVMFPHIYPPDRPAVKAFIEQTLAGTQSDLGLTFRTFKDGRIHHMRARCERVDDIPGKPRLVGYVQDITQSVENEQELRRHRERLSELVDIRTRELREANDRLQAMSRLKDEFVSNVSHELRTPITSLKVRLHTLQRKPEALTNYLPVLQRETQRLHQTIENLLFLSRLDQTAVEVHFQTVELVPFIQQYIADRQLLAEQHGVTLGFASAQNAPTAQADPSLLERMLSILISNALQYTPEGGTVTLGIVTRHQNGQQWAGFSIQDDGPGIPTEEHETIFHRFIRGKSAYESGQPGTGLGLSIAQEIAITHGGTIELTSSTTPPTGSTFIVWLPA